MKKFLMKDSFLKLISFVVAVLLWLYIITVLDPSVDVTVRDIQLRYNNQAVLESRGLCLVSDEDATVELKIRGSRKRIANIDSKNIYATVDLNNISRKGTFSLPINLSIPYEYDEIVKKDPYNAEIFIDEIVRADRDVKIITSGSPASGYVAGTPTTSVKVVSLEGAATMIEQIANVGVTLNFDDRSAEIKDTENIFFIGKDGKPIDKEDQIYTLVKADINAIDVECAIYKLKSVPVKVDAHSNFIVDEYKISVQPANVTIYGESEILDTIEEIKTEPVSIDNVEEEIVSASLVLPEGVKLRDGITEISVKIEKKD